jgi:hypothetical protein
MVSESPEERRSHAAFRSISGTHHLVALPARVASSEFPKITDVYRHLNPSGARASDASRQVGRLRPPRRSRPLPPRACRQRLRMRAGLERGRPLTAPLLLRLIAARYGRSRSSCSRRRDRRRAISRASHSTRSSPATATLTASPAPSRSQLIPQPRPAADHKLSQPSLAEPNDSLHSKDSLFAGPCSRQAGFGYPRRAPSPTASAKPN